MAVYKCGNWTFVPDNQELIYKDGTREQLPSRLSNCLLTLISAQGKTVSYDELLHEVWGTTHKDSSTISSVVSEVRKLIGCGQNEQKLIVTVPKRGYRFNHTVEVVDSTGIEESSATIKITATTPQQIEQKQTEESKRTIPTHQSPLITTRRKFALVGSLIAILITTLIFITKPSGTLIQTVQISGDYEVLSHETGREDEFDVSSDGRWLLYVNKANNKPASLIVKELTTGEKQQLVANGDYYFGSPVFSKDSKKIVFHKQSAEQCEVWSADFKDFELKQSNTQKLTNCGKGGFWSTTAFSEDGNHVYFSRANALTDPFKVHRVDLRTGFERSITFPTSSGRGDYAFSMSPDGEQLAIVRNVLWQETHVLLSNTQNHQSELVFKLPYLIDRVGWLNKQSLVWCDENEQLWSYDLTSQTQSLLAKIKFSCNYPVVAAQQLFAIKKAQIKNAIWQLSMNKAGKFITEPTISSPYYDFNAMFGPNNSLYFLSNRSGEEQLWQQTGQNYYPYKQVELPRHARELEFSADTNSFYGLAEKRLFRYDLEIGEVEWLSKKQHQVFNFSITDNGHLLFSEGKDEYWTLKSLDLYSLKITNLNLNAFSARQVGEYLYFTKFHENGLWKKNLQTGDIELFIKNIDMKFITFWDIWNKTQLVWADDNKFKIFDLNTGQLIDDSQRFKGHVGYVKCSDQNAKCVFSFRENAETEIINFTPITN